MFSVPAENRGTANSRTRPYLLLPISPVLLVAMTFAAARRPRPGRLCLHSITLAAHCHHHDPAPSQGPKTGCYHPRGPGAPANPQHVTGGNSQVPQGCVSTGGPTSDRCTQTICFAGTTQSCSFANVHICQYPRGGM